MDKLIIKLKDGSEIEYPVGTTIYQIAETISKRLAKEAVVGKIDGKLVDLHLPLEVGGELEILTFKEEEGQDVFRHSSAHILAQAVQNLFPGTKLGIGPAIKNGFYYDFDSEHKFIPEDLEKIEQEMTRIIKDNIDYERKELSRNEAIDLFREKGEAYKIELIEDLPEDETISIYAQGEFCDLCAGPHVPSTGKIKAVKLTSVAGAYWRGDEKNKMLQRIYGTSFPKKSVLEEHLLKLEEAKKRDHRKLGAQLELFTILEEGPGFPFFFPKGMILRNQLVDFWREEHQKAGYQEINTPVILNRSLWETSGHWDHYQENMYFTKIDEQDFAVKPMNCPGSMLVYKSKMHSYRDLPLRMGELGLVHRHELSGALHGLMRVRCFTQDDAHIFMLPSQIKDEIKGVIELVDYFYKAFGFEYHIELSTKPEKAMGSDEIWDKAIGALKEALREKDIDYILNEGDGAFYGPKIDFHLKDCLDRTWQCGTIQLDFLMPEKFDLNYIGEDGNKHRPVMIHRVVFGSIERFIGILTEHYAGAFPTWLAPVQVKVLPISEKFTDYALTVEKMLKDAGVRVEVDARNEKIGYKIREGQLEKVPYLLVIGEKEVNALAVAVRKRGEGDLGQQSLQEFIGNIKEDINKKG